MPAPRFQKSVKNVVVAQASAPIAQTQISAVQVASEGYPFGDNALHGLSLRVSGNLNFPAPGAAAQIVPQGGLRFVRSVTVKTDKHGSDLLSGYDGIALADIAYCKRGVRPAARDVADAKGTPTFDYYIPLPFFDKEGARGEDAVVDLIKSKPSVEVLYGIADDFISGAAGTRQVQVLNQELSCEYQHGPLEARDLPEFQPYWTLDKQDVVSTTTQKRYQLTYGDKLIKRLWIMQRGADGSRLANSLCGVNDSDRLSLKLNGVSIVDNMQWRSLQHKNAYDFGIPAMPVGVACLDFQPSRAGGSLLSRALNTITDYNGTLELNIDQTDPGGSTDGQFWFCFEGLRYINPPAQRPKAETPAKA